MHQEKYIETKSCYVVCTKDTGTELQSFKGAWGGGMLDDDTAQESAPPFWKWSNMFGEKNVFKESLDRAPSESGCSFQRMKTFIFCFLQSENMTPKPEALE